MHSIMEQDQFNINIILFVDALDEYAGSYGEIVVDCAKERPKVRDKPQDLHFQPAI